MRKNSAESWSKSQANFSTPITNTMKVTMTMPSTTVWRQPAGPAAASGADSAGSAVAAVSGAPRERRANRIVPPIQTSQASARATERNCQPLTDSSWATFCAMPTWNGLMKLKDAPTAAAPRLMATAVRALKPRRRTSRSSTGTKAMSSSCIWIRMPPQREREPDDRDRPDAPAGQAPREPLDQPRQRPRSLHDRERAAHEKDVEDDRGRIGHALGDGDQGVERAHRAGRHLVVRAGDHDLPPGRLVLAAIILAGRQHPGERRRGDDAEHEQDERVGQPDARGAHAGAGLRASGSAGTPAAPWSTRSGRSSSR